MALILSRSILIFTFWNVLNFKAVFFLDETKENLWIQMIDLSFVRKCHCISMIYSPRDRQPLKSNGNLKQPLYQHTLCYNIKIVKYVISYKGVFRGDGSNIYFEWFLKKTNKQKKTLRLFHFKMCFFFKTDKLLKIIEQWILRNDCTCKA